MASIGDYRLLNKLGEGAAGEVYLATPITGKPFAKAGDPLAIKLYKESILQQKDQLQRIEREFRVGSEMTNPNLVRMHEVHTKDTPRPYLVMEWVDGMTLDRWVSMFH